MSSVLTGAGFTVQTMANFSETMALLQRMPRSSSEIMACAVGWPDYGEPMADDVFDLLSRDQYEHLPVLILADSSSAGAVNWMMKRPRSALLNWGDYNEAGEALLRLMRPATSSTISLDATSHANLRVLLVDDSATVRMAFQKLLTKQGYQVEVASSVAEGKAKFAACAACHGADGKGMQAVGAPNLSDKVWLHGWGEQAIVNIVTQGRQNVMPAQGRLLTPEQVHVLGAYVLNMSKATRVAAN